MPPESIRLWQHRVIVRSTCERLCHPKIIHIIINLIATECKLDPELWSYQKSFFQNLIIGTFCENDDSPGWVIVSGARRSFMDRKETNRMTDSLSGSPHQVLGEPRKIFSANKIGYNSITLQSNRFKTDRILICGPAGAPAKDSGLWSMQIRRRMYLHDQRRTSLSDERWTFIACPDDRSELKRGYNPAVEQFRLKENRIQTAPMVSLARFCWKSRTVYSLNFSLSPGMGHVIDFREIEQPLDFAMATDLINTSLLIQSTRVTTSDRL